MANPWLLIGCFFLFLGVLLGLTVLIAWLFFRVKHE